MDWITMLVYLSMLFLSTLLTMFYYVTKDRNFFKDRGIKFLKPKIFFGNMFNLFLQKEHMNLIIQRAYKTFNNEKYFGFFNFTLPTLIVKDPELIKQITIKDFDHFMDHFEFADERDPLFFNNLFMLKGQKWHRMRNSLSPAFTSSKMKDMMCFMEECANNFIVYLNQITTGKDYTEVNMKDLLTKYTNDSIASCAFGIQTDSLKDPNNEFYMFSKNLTQIEPTEAIKSMCTLCFPLLRKIMNVKLMGKKTEEYFRQIVLNLMKQRSESGAVRRDMIHLLMLAKKGKLQEEKVSDNTTDDTGFAAVPEATTVNNAFKKNWSDDDIVAQSVIFVFGGFEPIASLLTSITYQLAINPEVQDKLREEIDEYVKDNGRMVTYEDIRKLTYLDMVVSETLRLLPPASNMDRRCTKTYELPATNGQNSSYTLQKGDVVWIPTYAIHRDPKYFPNPDEFIPERFSEENKKNIIPFTYMPFGFGPRICIGNRFALLEIKLLIFNLLANYEIVRTPSTEVPLTIRCHTFLVQAKNDIILGLKKRTESPVNDLLL